MLQSMGSKRVIYDLVNNVHLIRIVIKHHLLHAIALSVGKILKDF